MDKLASVAERDAYGTLQRAIVTGELSPGERLIEEELAEELGESRGAIRAALVHLDHDGLVVRERNRGARVRRVTVDEAIEILEARAALEPLAAGYAALRRTAAEAQALERLIGEMEQLLGAGDLLAMSNLNASLHRHILEASRHRVAADFCGRLHSQIVRFQFRTVLAPGRASASIAEHRAIVMAIVDRDRPAGAIAMQRHLSAVVDVLRTTAS